MKKHNSQTERVRKLMTHVDRFACKCSLSEALNDYTTEELLAAADVYASRGHEEYYKQLQKKRRG